MTRDEYVQWCKDRALVYLREGDVANAITSMLSDMDKGEDTKVSPVLAQLGMLRIMEGDPRQARRFIEGFN